MKLDRFTVKSREAISDAQQLCGKNGNPEIRPHHLMMVLLTQKEGVVGSLLRHLEVDIGALTREAARILDKLPKVSG
ncbi:MAG TPA: Clp protease N-terminal domain-containing protein, partial [Elusimicrobiota bacterium]|nr:Clp protease N-terminal domain-containing protein [Elusimicrobiota bacterium]